MKIRQVYNETQNRVLLPKGRWCASGWCHFKGLMMRRHLPTDEGLIFVYKRASRMDTSIHMFFVFFPISVIWLDKEQVVVSVKLAKPWRPFYAPSQPAQYFIEASPHLIDEVAIGDKLRFEEK
jgi:hypothetical protein